VKVELFQQLLLDAGADAVAEERPVGDHHPRARGPPGRSRLAVELAHDELKEEERRLGRLPVLGEVTLDALLLLAAEGRIGEDDVDTILLADLGELVAESVARVDLGGIQAVQQQVHLAEQVGKRLRLVAGERSFLQHPPVGDRLNLGGEVIERFDEEAAGAGRGIEHGLAQAGIGHRDHEPHDRPRRVELSRVARGVAHLAQHGLVERPQRGTMRLSVTVRCSAIECGSSSQPAACSLGTTNVRQVSASFIGRRPADTAFRRQNSSVHQCFACGRW
jgi:hypothetical protein